MNLVHIGDTREVQKINPSWSAYTVKLVAKVGEFSVTGRLGAIWIDGEYRGCLSTNGNCGFFLI